MAAYDLIVIGGGPGGYVAAIRAAQLGQKTAVVERDKAGGRCLNYACIPAKTVLHTAEVFAEVSNGGAELGVKTSGVSIDWKAVQARREKVSKTLADGVQMLWKKNKVDFLQGEGSLAGGGKVKVAASGKSDTHEAKAIVLATGSVEMPIPGIDFSDRVLDTWGAWSLAKLPKALVVAGAGASGSEIASAYARMGVEVTLVEMLGQVLPLEDKDMSRVVERQFKSDGMNVMTGTKVEGVEEQKTGVKVKAGDQEIKADHLVIAGGRRADTDGLGLDAAGVKTGENGQITIDEYQRTSAEGVFAIGDLVRGPALAHKASEEGVVAVEAAAGQDTHPVNVDLVPGATFCHPQVASVGLTEEEAKEQGRQIKVGKFKLGGVGASVVYDDRAGMVKIVGDSEYGEILGAHIVGNRACDMISEFVDTMALEGGYPELARIVHPHPTISEAVLDATRAVEGWAIHA
ncbi:MAG: dihydrolipoyl dehydrogenase [Solirubrobacterales bacterium]